MKWSLIYIPVALFFTSCLTTQDKSQLESLSQSLNEMNSTLVEQKKELEKIQLAQEQHKEQLALLGEEQSSLSGKVDFLKENQKKDQEDLEPVIIEKNKNYILNGKIVLGQVEKLYIDPPRQSFISRIDTGATSSSLHAKDMVFFQRDGKDWVRFNINHQNSDENITLERPIIDHVLIKQTNSKEPISRPVVSFFVRLGSIEMESEFTLADRSEMTYPVLVGRNLLMDLAVVDVSKKFIAQGESSDES